MPQIWQKPDSVFLLNPKLGWRSACLWRFWNGYAPLSQSPRSLQINYWLIEPPVGMKSAAFDDDARWRWISALQSSHRFDGRL
jgi:hypothetical protein